MSESKGVSFSNLTNTTIHVAGFVVGGDLHRNDHNAPPAPADDAALTAAVALLASMLTEDLPPPGTLPAGSRLPMGRNALFTGREAELRALAAGLKGEQDVAITPRADATTGSGGMGKSQLSNEFAWRYDRYFKGGVFWLSFAEAEVIPVVAAM